MSRTSGGGGPWWGCGSIVPALSGVRPMIDWQTSARSDTCRAAKSRQKRVDALTKVEESLTQVLGPGRVLRWS
jgi:hypothetical protein